MPASKHPDFVHPKDKEATIWRYMDFTKYVSMLERGGLYFCRADLLRLIDPFEGSVSQAALDEDRRFLADGLPGLSRQQIDGIMKSKSISRQSIKKIIYINCWHVSSDESAAMWRLYAQSLEAIAIRSTFSKLFGCLPKNYYVGLVKYIDYKTETIPRGNFFRPFLRKRRSYKHEDELRVLHLKPPEHVGSGDIFKRKTPKGIWVELELADLISQVYVSPTSQPWFRDLVQSVSKKYGLDRPVVRSDLDTAPIL